MAFTCWTNRFQPAGLGPLKIQAQTIKNNGLNDVLVFDIEDDMPLSSSMIMAFSIAVINPGCTLDVVNWGFPHSFCNISDPDRDVTLHSDSDIHVEISSSDICDRWQNDPYHPWNGGALPNGSYTKRFDYKNNQGVQVNTLNGISAAPIWVTLNIENIPDSKVEDIGINRTQSNCICTSRSLFNNGCICGHVKRKNWGL